VERGFHNLVQAGFSVAIGFYSSTEPADQDAPAEGGRFMRVDLRARATEALKAALQGVSGIKVRQIQTESPGRHRAKDIIANIDIYGHNRTLVCRVREDTGTLRIRRTLKDLNKFVEERTEDTMPILIAPSLSQEAQTLCTESNAGFLDLEGNVRLVMKEVFIAKRSLPHRHPLPPLAEPLPTSETARLAHVA
jgi:hypothetical protein